MPASLSLQVLSTNGDTRNPGVLWEDLQVPCGLTSLFYQTSTEENFFMLKQNNMALEAYISKWQTLCIKLRGMQVHLSVAYRLRKVVIGLNPSRFGAWVPVIISSINSFVCPVRQAQEGEMNIPTDACYMR